MKKKRQYTQQQLAIIRRNYAEKSATQNKSMASVNISPSENKTVGNYRDLFPKKFPFWARFKPNKSRTTLVIDEEKNDKDKIEFVHREAIHCTEDNKYVLSGDYEKIYPNPDKTDKKPMYLKRPRRHLINFFKPHNKNLDMPEDLRQRYDKNNHKNETPDDNDGDKNT